MKKTDWDRIKIGAPIALALLAGWSNSAGAGIIAADSYVIGPNPAAGQYVAGASLNDSTLLGSLVTPGFANGPYTGGTGTVQFSASATGLDYAPFGESSATSGKVLYSAAPLGPTYRAVARNLTPISPVATTGTFWMSLVVSQDGTATPANGFALAGFGNTVAPVLGTTTGVSQGLFFGFAQDTTAQSNNLVLRARTAATSTTSDVVLLDGSTTSTVGVFGIVAEVNVNSNGSLDHVSYWVDPTDLSSVAALTASSLVSGSLDTFAFQDTNGFLRLNYTAENWNGNVGFDGAKLATSLADLAPAAVPEPGSVVLLCSGLIGLSGVAARQHRRWTKATPGRPGAAS